MIEYIILFIFGLFFGSFAGATVWRIRSRQLISDEKQGEKVDKRELKRLKPLAKMTIRRDRSQCLSCGRTLKWYDLFPLFSWLSTGGKCRYCHRFIGWFEPLIEVGTAILFVLVGIFSQDLFVAISGVSLILWLGVMVMMVMLFSYDMKWYLLPNVVIVPLLGVSVVIAVLRLLNASDVVGATFQTLASVAVLGGIYGLLYYYSKWRYGEERTWVGFGDVKLTVILGLLLGQWQLAFLAVFIANLAGMMTVLPLLAKGKMKLQAHIPFGPFLIVGFLVALFYGQEIVNWYLSLHF